MPKSVSHCATSGHAQIIDAGTRVETLLEILDELLASKVVKELIDESSAADADAAPKRAGIVSPYLPYVCPYLTYDPAPLPANAPHALGWRPAQC